MLMRVRGLKPLPKGGYYELFLTRNGKLGPACGTFRVHDGTTEVPLNAPYRLKRFNGWVVTCTVTAARARGHERAAADDVGALGRDAAAATNAACVIGIASAKNVSQASA